MSIIIQLPSIHQSYLGHPEGIFDAMGNIYLGAAKAIRGENFYDHEFPTIYEESGNGFY